MAVDEARVAASPLGGSGEDPSRSFSLLAASCQPLLCLHRTSAPPVSELPLVPTRMLWLCPRPTRQSRITSLLQALPFLTSARSVCPVRSRSPPRSQVQEQEADSPVDHFPVCHSIQKKVCCTARWVPWDISPHEEWAFQDFFFKDFIYL